MMLTVLLTSLALAASADFGPYQQSTAYDDGEFGAWPTESYQSSPVIGPSLNYLLHNEMCDDGRFTMLAPSGGVVRTPGPMIIDQNGHLVWTKQYGRTENVNVYRFKDASYMTFCVGDSFIAGYGDASTCYMLDSSYEEVYKIHGANDLVVDLREFHITHDDTALLTVSNVIPADLQSVGGRQDGWILDGTFQEVDIETGELLFQWQASEHFVVSEAYTTLDETGGSAENSWDFFHITSVDKDGKGNFLVSSLAMNCLAYIDGQSGDVLWKLGGKSNMFEDFSSGDATNFNVPYHARFTDDGNAITLFDTAESASRGLYLDLDHERKTVQVRYQYRNPSDIGTESGGSMQLLDSGNVLVSYGTSAAWTEYAHDGTPLCEVHFGAESHFNDHGIASYRISKHDWAGHPKTQPSLTLSGYEAIVSWNGATEVVTWVLEGSNTIPAAGDNHTDEKFTLITAQFKSGFETILSIPPETRTSILRVAAVDYNGTTLSSSMPVAWNPTPEEMAAVGATDPAQVWRLVVFFLVGFLSAAALGVIVWVLRRRLSRRPVRLEPSYEEYERARVGWKPADPEYNGDENLSDDEIGLLLGEPDEEARSRRSSVEREAVGKEM